MPAQHHRILSVSRYLRAAVVWAVVAGGAAHGQEILEAEAIAGKPFGVARVLLAIDPQVDPHTALVRDADDRLHYPVSQRSTRPVRRLLRDLVGAPQRVELYFLFTGNEPLELSLAGGARPIRVRATSDPRAHQQLLDIWWQLYASPERMEEQSQDYPTLLEDYLVGSLSDRLQLRLPEVFLVEPESDDLTHAVRVLGGAESVRSQWVRRVAAGQLPSQRADQPLPKPLDFPTPAAEPDDKVQVESLADRVPPELLYVRFGSFPNYLWFSRRLEEWSGEIRSLVSERSIDYGLQNRQQEQLCLTQSALGELLGPAVISDVALIGTDMFQRQGAAMGILFEARNSQLLDRDIKEDRSAALEANPTAVEEQIKIGDRTVSFISTPDNRLRSFYLLVDNYHLVTTSRAIVERFVQVAGDGKSLGKLAEFRYARQLFPLDRNDTVFVYLSAPFLQNLISPQFQVELQRRLRSVAEMDVLAVARAEAQAQGRRGDSIEQLISARLLPKGFGVCPDGSRLEEVEGRLVDSLRGPRGMFVPVPDVPPGKVTASEAEESLEVARRYAASWEQMTPIVAAISRAKSAREGLEQVTLDLRITPLAAKQYQMLASQLGAPSRQRLAPIAFGSSRWTLVTESTLARMRYCCR